MGLSCIYVIMWQDHIINFYYETEMKCKCMSISRMNCYALHFNSKLKLNSFPAMVEQYIEYNAINTHVNCYMIR